MKAHGTLRQLRDREKFRAWLVRMTWRLALNRRRGDLRRVNRELAAPVPDHGPTSEDVLISEERADRLWRAIDALPEGMRMTIVLSGIDGHGTRDVAALMGVPEGKSSGGCPRRRNDCRRRCDA